MTYILQKKNSFKYISQFDTISPDVCSQGPDSDELSSKQMMGECFAGDILGNVITYLCWD